MRTLIVEDDFISRKMLQKILSSFGECDVAVNGREALEAFCAAHGSGTPYSLICLDIMMPEMNGHEVVANIRASEEQRGLGGLSGVKIIMTSGLDDRENVLGAFRHGVEAYLVKPIDRAKLLERLYELKLLTGVPTNGSRAGQP